MTTNETNKTADTILVASLARAIDFVKFAEAKNAALLAFASAWSLGVTTVINSPNPPKDMIAAMGVARGLFLLSILITVWSFIPKVRPEDFDRRVLPKNLLFFGHVAKIEIKDLKAAVLSRYVKDGVLTDDYLDDLSAQVGINSRIASKKYWLFGIASALVLLGLLSLAVPAVWSGVSGLMTTPLTPK